MLAQMLAGIIFSEGRTYNIDTAIPSNRYHRIERTEVHSHNTHLGGVIALWKKEVRNLTET